MPWLGMVTGILGGGVAREPLAGLSERVLAVCGVLGYLVNARRSAPGSGLRLAQSLVRHQLVGIESLGIWTGLSILPVN